MDAIDLLIFPVRNFVFGVWTQQIEELLKVESKSNPGKAAEEYTILYRQRDLRVIDLSMRLKLLMPGVEQPETGKSRSEVRTLHKYVCNLADDSCFSSKILVVKRQEHEYIGIQVENVKHIVTTTVDHIYALPKIMERHKQIAELWGIALLPEDVALLIDLAQFA